MSRDIRRPSCSRQARHLRYGFLAYAIIGMSAGSIACMSGVEAQSANDADAVGLEPLATVPGIVYTVALWRGGVITGGHGIRLHPLEAERGESLVLPTPGIPLDLLPLDGRLLVADRSFGDTPSSLRLVGLVDAEWRDVSAVDLPGQALRVAAEGERAWVACDRAGLQAVSIEEQEVLRPLPKQSVSGWIRAVAASDGFVYAADAEVGLRTFVVTPEGLEEVGRAGEGGRPHDLAVSPRWLVVAHDARGVEIFTRRDPARPQRWEILSTSGTAWGVALEGDLLAVADGHAGVRLFRLSVPEPARLLAQHAVTGFTWDVALTPDRLFAAAGDTGLLIFRLPARVVSGGQFPTASTEASRR